MPTTIATDFGAIKSATNTNVSTKTSALSITPHDVGDQVEAICDKIIADINFQNVIDQGNSATSAGGHTGTISLNNGGGDFRVVVDPAGTQIQRISTSDMLIGIFPAFPGVARPCLVLLDNGGGGHLCAIEAGTLTADRILTEPDHSGAIATNDGVTNQSSGALVGASFITVAHGLSFTPTRIFITPKDSTTANALGGGYWVDTVGATTFKLNFTIFTGTLVFDWQAFP